MVKYITKVLADYITNLRYENLPKPVIERAKACLIDWLGVTIAGSRSPEAKIVYHTIKNLESKEEASVILYNTRASAIYAALTNGTMSHSYDFDDVLLDSTVHPGCVIVTTALAVGECCGSSGKQIINAIVVGYDVIGRVGMAVNRTPPKAHAGQGFHPTATCGVFGAAATAASLMGLNNREIENAMGIAGSFAAGLMQCVQDGSMTKRIHPGKASSEGILSALLAKNGLTGPQEVFEGRDGFIRAYTTCGDASILTNELGNDFYVLKDAFKYYPCCGCIHAALDAIFDIKKDYGIKPEEIVEIKAYSPTSSQYIVGEPLSIKHNPRTTLEAQMSLPYCLAVAICDGEVTLKQFTKQKIKNPDIIALTQKVITAASSELDSIFSSDIWPAKVIILTKKGQTIEKKINRPRGHPKRPLKSQEFRYKFESLVNGKISNKTREIVLNMLWNLEQVKTISEVVSLINKQISEP